MAKMEPPVKPVFLAMTETLEKMVQMANLVHLERRDQKVIKENLAHQENR